MHLDHDRSAVVVDQGASKPFQHVELEAFHIDLDELRDGKVGLGSEVVAGLHLDVDDARRIRAAVSVGIPVRTPDIS